MAKPTKKTGPSRAQRALQLFEQWASYREEAAPEAAVDLALVGRLARKQLELEALLETAEENAKSVQQRLFDVRCLELPEALAAAGLSKVALSTGEQVEVKTEYYASLGGKYREPALAWLREQGFDDLLQIELTVSFGKGQGAAQKKVLQFLEKLAKDKKLKADLTWNSQETVNTGSFKAIVREQLENGVTVPVEELGVTVQDATKITTPKAKSSL